MMSAAPGDQIGRKAFERQARQILRRLLSPNAHLMKQDKNSYGLYTPRSNSSAQMSCDQELIAAMCAHDFLVKVGDRLTASQTGAMWLRRAGLKDKDIFRSQHQLRLKHKTPSSDPKSDICEINVIEDPLRWLSRRCGSDGKKIISEVQLQAGHRLQSDFLRSTMRPRMTIDLTAPPSNKYSGRQPHDGLRLDERAIAARARFDRAVQMLGAGLAEIAVEVCCHMHGLEQAERTLGWPKRAGKVVLGIALTRLARHYGFMR